MSEYKDETKGGKKHQFSVVRVEGLQGLQDLLNSTHGKVDSWQRVGEGATFICVISGVPVPEPVKEEPAEAAAAEPEENGKKAAPQKKSA